MTKRVFQTITITLAITSIGLAGLLAAQKAGTQRKNVPAQRGKRTGRQPARAAAPQPVPIRAADPNRAPQNLVDDALYVTDEFFGANAVVARPYSDALARLSTVIQKYPKDARLRPRAAWLAESLGQYDRSTAEMTAYADLKKRSSDSLRRLASYYHYRAMFAEEVRTLQELARSLRVDERGAVYRRAAGVVRSYKVTGVNPADFFAELVAADPANVQPVRDYIQELRLSRQYRPALAAIEQYKPRFPSELGYFLKTAAEINQSMGDRKTAEAVYDSAFDPAWSRDIKADYYGLLRRFGRYRIVRRNLQEKVRAGATDLETVGRLFSIFSYEGNYRQAARVLQELEARRSQRRGTSSTGAQGAGADWSSKDLQTAATLFASIGYYDQASRYLYTLYLGGSIQPGTASREETLFKLFKVMLDAAGSPTRLASGDLSFYRDIAEIDQHPGFLNGVLSLILSGSDIESEFKAEESAAGGYFNRAFAHRIFTAFKSEYPQSSHLGEMYLGIVDVFASLGEQRIAIDAGREFQERFPESKSYADVGLRMADCYVALKDRAGERRVLADLLNKLAATKPAGMPLVPSSNRRWRFGSTPEFRVLVDRIKYNIEAYNDTYDPTEDGSGPAVASEESDEEEEESDEPVERGDEPESDSESSAEPGGPTYSSVLERLVSSLAADDRKTDTVALFWGEIKKHPKEEGLYERFLQWLGQAQLINEQLKAYNSAVREFDSNTWYHRIARWYVRQKRGRELNSYARKLIDVFNEEEVSDYLYRFAGYGPTAKGDSLNWDERFAFDLYSYAHNKFPRNLFFVRGMLTYLLKNDRVRWEKLSAEYYFLDRSIRDPYLEWLSKQGQLRRRYADAKQRRGASGATTQTALATPYSVFAADAALWLSHHDEALDAYRQLAAAYPGDVQYSERLAELTRSFGQTSDKLFAESAKLYSELADFDPIEHDYRIKAGEVYAQLGDFQRAGQEWDKLIKQEPGERKTYLEVATVYWDYYQYDQAIRVFKDLRAVTGDQSIYAYRLGAVYEGKRDLDSAIEEYVKVLAEPGEGRDTVTKRLAQLSRRTGVAERIATAFQKARAAAPADWQLVIGYAFYQAERDHQADALALLRTEVSRATDVPFLETTRDLFRAILRPEDEQQVITRLTEVARDEREAMMYRLQLAAFLERRNQVDAAIAVVGRLVAEYPTNVGVIEETSQFYWRAGLLDRSIDLYKRTIARSVGSNKRTFRLHLARMQSQANKLVDAEATLREVYNEDRSDTHAFSELAKVLGAENKLEELAALYQEAFKQAKESGLGSEGLNARVIELRLGMFKTMDALGRYDAAVDQYIEVINLSPEDPDRLATGLEYAEQHALTQRIVSYYEKLSKEAFKNYRWQIVLGRIYERQGNLPGAAEQYRTAVVNEPQMPELRFNLASVLTRQRRYDEALAVLRDGWTLSGRDPSWLIEVAKIQIRQGHRDEAIKTVRQALASKQNASTDARLNIATSLVSWGIYDEAVRLFEETFTALPKTLKNEYVDPSRVTAYVRALVRTEPVVRAYLKIEKMRGVYEAIGANSQDSDGYKARNIVSGLDTALREDFGKGVVEFATAAEAAELASLLQAPVDRASAFTESGLLKRYLSIARAASMEDLEERILTKLKDLAWDARPKNSPTVTSQDTQYYSELRALVQFYDRHARYERGAEVLAAEQRRDPYKNRFDYEIRIADEYRLAGSTQREIEALRRAYAAASGDLTSSQTEWVERYLNLLYSTGAKGELQRLSSLYSPYQLQLISFLMGKKEQLLALDAIDRTRQSPAWVASRSAEVGLFLGDSSPDVEPLFKAALGWKPIGQMLNRQPPAGKELVGDDWYLASRNYGYWLGMVGRETDSRRFIVAEIEGHPSDSQAQVELAAYYLDRKNPTRAAEHVQLAAERAAGSTEVKVLRGRVALAARDRQGALDAFNSIISGATHPSEAETYVRVMASNGFLREALSPLENFIIRYVNTAYRSGAGRSQVENIQPLVRLVAERARADGRLTGDVAAFFQSTINALPLDTVLARMLIDERLLPEVGLAPIYRTVHQRLSDTAAAVFGTDQYDNGFYNGDRWIYPTRELAEWRKIFVDFLIRQRSFDEARLLVATIKREQADLQLARTGQADEEDSYSYEDRYEWVPLASALIELRAGREPQKAIAELRRYSGIEVRQGSEQEVSEDRLRQRSLKAYALLMSERREAEADAFLYEAYRIAVRSRLAGDASFAGLAEIEARRGRLDEAVRLLKVMAERSTDNLRALALAAETSARINRFEDAIRYRQQITQADPGDATNVLELARTLATAGRGDDALGTLAALIEQRNSGNSIRAQAAEIIGDLVRADRSLGSRAADLLANRAGDGSQLALATVREAGGDPGQAREILSRIVSSGGPLAAVAQTKLGLLALAGGRNEEAASSFEKALNMDADGLNTDAIAFKAAGPRAQLVLLYGRTGRDAAAFNLAEGDESQRTSFVSIVFRSALTERGEGGMVPARFEFEPSLEDPRSRSGGLRTIGELNAVATTRARSELLASLTESAVRLDRYDRAITLARIRVAEAAKPEDKVALDKRLAEIIAADRARTLRLASLVRFDRSGATRTIYAPRAMGD
jgi:predicted Zn-dependent protease